MASGWSGSRSAGNDQCGRRGEQSNAASSKKSFWLIDPCSFGGSAESLLLGLSNVTRVLLVCHCERDNGETIRIISARKATQKERENYRGGNT
jgi:hypothetical protein